MNASRYFLSLFFLTAFAAVAFGGQTFHRPHHHELAVTLDPEDKTAEITDTLTLYPDPYQGSTIQFLLHADYKLDPLEIPHKGEWKSRIETVKGSEPLLQRISVTKPMSELWPRFFQLVFRYHGPYHDPLRSSASEQSKQPGSGKKDAGIFLSGGSYFYPTIVLEPKEDPLLTFQLGVTLPHSWKVVSQGKRIRETTQNGPKHTLWQCDDPMEEIFLVADRFHEYSDRYEDIQLFAFLRDDDPQLAQKYLKAAKSYIVFFERQLGEYPYVKFALVENALQTGYGMPSFTLMGSRILRFPFILHSSYPHEILHNWWGNGVYVDPEDGNWSEGLTTYLADHLLEQIQGKGDRYRFQQLVKYLNYINPENEISVSGFQSRQDMASQTIGYGKWLMVLNMLRLEVGNKLFWEALGDFYFNQRFHRAGFKELRKHFEAFHGQSLEPFFKQWVEQKGAPELVLSNTTVEQLADRYRLTLEIQQKQQPPLFAFHLPVAVWYDGSDIPLIQNLEVDAQAIQHAQILVPGEPQAVMLDPYYDVFRKLDRREVPPSIGQTYGASKVVAVLTSHTTRALKESYHAFAKSIDNLSERILDEVFEFPDDSAVWIFGRNNQAAEKLVDSLKNYGVTWTNEGMTLEETFFPWENHSMVLTLAHPKHPNVSVTWVIADSAKSVPGLIRKLPHYGKYGYLVFEGDTPDNRVKGTWPANRTGLMKTFQPGSYILPTEPPLTTLKPQ